MSMSPSRDLQRSKSMLKSPCQLPPNRCFKVFFCLYIYISVEKLQYEFTSYTTLQDYYTIQPYNTTETMPRGAKDYDYPETN